MKHTLSFHTVFIVNENIRWLEEFIQYYKKIGFDHFYLYDNEGTIGFNNEGTATTNKYDMPRITTTPPEDSEKLNAILEKYKNDITYVKWQPKDENGQIHYGYNESVKHFIENYGHETEWIACMDLDEFLFSVDNLNIPDYFRKLGPEISCVKLCQKKFIDRFLSDKANILEDYRCIDLYVESWWAPKNIFRPSDFINLTSMHHMDFKNQTHMIGQNLLRFNHYNVNSKQLDWMEWSMKQKFTLNGIDDGMKRYI